MTIGIRLKIDPSGLQQKCISGDFPQFLELSLLRTHIDGCYQSVCEAAVSRIFPKHLGKQTWRSCFKVKLCKNSKNSYFPKRALLRVSLSFGLRVSFIFLKVYRKVWIIMGEKLWRIEIAYFLSSCLWYLSYNYLLYGKKVRGSNIFVMIYTYFLPLFKIYLSAHKSSPPVVLKKRCSENMQPI